MSIKTWILDNVTDFNTKIKSEEDMKIKVLIPYLKSLGYQEEEMRFENAIEVNVGTKKTTVYSDIEIIINNKIELVIDAKKPTVSLSEKNILQSVSYAKLIDTPAALYGATTNGIDCVITNIFTGQRTNTIPTRAQLLRDIDKTKKRKLNEVEIREIRSVLLTLLEQKELYKVINKSKDIIEKKGLIRSDQSFKEMTKILLVKMNEERRVKAEEGQNRFLFDYLSASAKANSLKEIDIFKNLFNNAKNKYPSIYTHDDENVNILDNDCIIEVVKNIEPFSFLGTGDDIKGAVYEIFLKGTLRGDFDQYFTPRELVDFIVNFADPKIDDKILDPACGSGGFLIQAFNYVNQKIIDSPFSDVESRKKFKHLIDKCLWGHEADYDLHVLAKINLIMHGDGWNNIYQGDTLSSSKLKSNFFDLILTNPPFTIPYNFKKVLSKYEMGLGKDNEELDILFVEKSINALKPGGDLYIVLPEGLLNNKSYQYFRDWLLDKSYLLLSVSLPEGAFIPFGGSVSKTCIIGVRKKDQENKNLNKPKHIFLGRAIEVGYETGKKHYKQKDKNDLAEFVYQMTEIFSGLKRTSNNGECGWIESDKLSAYRIDANYLLNIIDRDFLKKKFNNLIQLKEICDIENISVNIEDNILYNYLEVPDISPETGTISNIRRLKGENIGGDSLHKFFKGDILFTRINPRKSRVTIAPNIEPFGVVSKEVYRIVYKENDYIKNENRYVICAILQSEHVRNQIVRLSTGSSSSRARVQPNDLLNDVFVPIPDEELQKGISKTTYNNMSELWELSQSFLKSFVKNQTELGTNIEINEIRSV